MNTELKSLFDKLDVSHQVIDAFKDAQLIEAQYNKSHQFILVDISIPQHLPLSIYLEVNDYLDKFDMDMKFVYEIKMDTLIDNIVFDYFHHFFKEKVSNASLYEGHYELKLLDDNLSITFSKEGLKDMYLNSKSKVEDAMKLGGFNLSYQYLVEENDRVNKQVDDLMKDEVKVMPSTPVIKKDKPFNNEVQKNNQSFYRKSLTDHSQYEVIKISDLNEEVLEVRIEGKIFDSEIEQLRSKKHIQKLKITDFKDSIKMVRFEGRGLTLEDLQSIKKGDWVSVIGDAKYSEFDKELVFNITSMQVIDSQDVFKKDDLEEKRVELKVHTKMSTMDGISHISDYLSTASSYGHKALAITDKGNLQAYPDAYNEARGKDVKVIYGLEANVVDESTKIVENATDSNFSDLTYVFFDFETTGFSSNYDKIIEIGAVKYKNGVEVGQYQSFVNPHQSLRANIVNITNITDSMLYNAPDIDKVIVEFNDFIKDSVLVAHNASFDMSFLQETLKNHDLPLFKGPIIDTLILSRALNPDKKAHNLKAVSKNYGVYYDSEVAHRADYDAMVLANVFNKMLLVLKETYQYKSLNDINQLIDKDILLKQRPFSTSLLVKNQDGLKDLFKLVSISHIDYFSSEPKLFKQHIRDYRSNLLVGSGTHNGEVYQNVRSVDDNKLQEIMSFYDYIEVVPIDLLQYKIDDGDYSNLDELIQDTLSIIRNAQTINKPIVAVGDVYYDLDIKQQFREVYAVAPKVGGGLHELGRVVGKTDHFPNNFYRTTQEMLDGFSFIDDKDLVYEMVVTNTNKIADMIEEVQVIKDKLYPPSFTKEDEVNFEKKCYENAYAQYGNPLPKIVEDRLVKELDSIIKHGFAVVYDVSSKLVEKSLSDGYLVGSRGSVGSSLVATMSNITEVNPLVPHYYCPSCQYSEFFEDGSVASGYDLEDKDCPKCGHLLKGDGQDIPFETFLGFEGDKVPDIDLNFSDQYQSTAHDYTKVLFNEEYVYRAGTIGTVAEKTAFGFVKGYLEKQGRENTVRKVEMERIAQGCEGVKRNTGQHPGGIIVIPDYMDVYDFTPINYPADKATSSWKTTHFDFHAIHDNVLKLDILGHLDPTAIKMLEDLTGIAPKSIPTNDPKVMSLFSSTKGIGIDHLVNYPNAAMGIPEFGTAFVRGMLEETNPATFAELVQISGLSHGTDVWLNNAQTLIKMGTCTLSEVIGCRDDIMVYLMYKGLEPKNAFTIMESVRKGKGLKEEWIEDMKKNNVPQWYIESCLKIKYMFPKAHAVAYVLMAVRVAWFKVYYPLEYYATFFSTRVDTFDIKTMSQGQESIQSKLRELQAKSLAKETSDKEEKLIIVLEIALEMVLRGYNFSVVDLYQSKASKWSINHENKSLIPPFTAIEGLGYEAAITVEEQAKAREFISKEDLLNRTKLNSTNLQHLDVMGSLDGLQEQNQLSLFDL